MLAVRIETCQGCGRCSMICFRQAITLTSGHAEIDEKRCNMCGLCIDECKQGAITPACSYGN